MIAALGKNSTAIHTFNYLESKINVLDSSKLSSFEYNELKIKKGIGEYLGSNVFADDRKTILGEMERVLSLNSKVKRNKFLHMSINLPHKENASNELFLLIANDYLKELGYSNCPFLIYRHHDKEHNHIHVLTTTVNYEGEKIKDLNDHYKCMVLSRKLENKYGFKKTIYSNKEKQKASFNTIKMEEYFVQNALKKALKSYSSKRLLTSLLPAKFINSLNKKGLNNNEIKEILGVDNYNRINNYLKECGYYNMFLKNNFKLKLDKIIDSSNDYKEFIDNCKKYEVYVRPIWKNDSKQFLFVNKENGFEISSNKLGAGYSFNNIIKTFNKETVNKNKKEFTYQEQKNFISSMVKRNLSISNNIDHLNSLLLEKGIEMIFIENGGGIYGVKFKSCNIDNPYIFKGSTIDFSWNKILKELNSKKTLDANVFVKDVIDKSLSIVPNYDNNAYNYHSPIQSIIDDIGYSPLMKPKKPHNEEEEEMKKRKKKKGKGLNK